ncbi:hypothetical protein [Novosphingobium sp.]|uniref:hypothetical protein n=1 Tax=Novosphingobium sp. TaxID=1874826 RepID=UPI0031DDF8ED
MTAPLFYTIATHRADGLPQLLEVTRQREHTLHGRCGDTVMNVRRGVCSGRFETPSEARRALKVAHQVCEKHRSAILKARRSLEDANLARKRELRQRLGKITGLQAG